MKDTIGDRMKDFYEDRFRYSLPRRNYTIIRVDGKAFHTYTKGMKVPFDEGFIDDMNSTAAYLCKNIQGAKFAYVQSDEISILLTDFDELETDMWFKGNLQKMASVASSLATSEFNRLRLVRSLGSIFHAAEDTFAPTSSHEALENLKNAKQANFDARIFQISAQMEVMNYFIWRQQDATRNSISAVAQSLYSHKELEGKTSNEKQEMIFAKSGVNWNDYPSRQKRGGFVEKVMVLTGVFQNFERQNKGGPMYPEQTYPAETKPVTVRHKWTLVECPVFTQDRSFLGSRIPAHEIFNTEENTQ